MRPGGYRRGQKRRNHSWCSRCRKSRRHIRTGVSAHSGQKRRKMRLQCQSSACRDHQRGDTDKAPLRDRMVCDVRRYRGDSACCHSGQGGPGDRTDCSRLRERKIPRRREKTSAAGCRGKRIIRDNTQHAACAPDTAQAACFFTVQLLSETGRRSCVQSPTPDTSDTWTGHMLLQKNFLK